MFSWENLDDALIDASMEDTGPCASPLIFVQEVFDADGHASEAWEDEDVPHAEALPETNAAWGLDHRLLSAADEVALARQLADVLAELNTLGRDGSGATRARRRSLATLANDIRDTFLRHNLRLVHYVARRYRNTPLDDDDLIHEGILGLFRAIERYDAAAGVRFSTYAFWWIRQAMGAALRHADMVRLPSNLLQDRSRVRATRLAFVNTRGRWPTRRETSELSGVALRVIDDLMPFDSQPLSLHAPEFDGEGLSLADTLGNEDEVTPEAMVEALEEQRQVASLLEALPDREAEVLRMRFGIGLPEALTLRDIGAKLRLSPERIRQIERSGLDRLRQTASGHADNIMR